MAANLTVLHLPDLAPLSVIDSPDSPASPASSTSPASSASPASPGETSLGRRLGRDLDGTFAEVVTEFEAVVFTTALRVCGRTDDAEDLTAETFLRAYAGLRRYSEERIAELQFRPWLITICLNQWRNQLRAATRRPALSSSLSSSLSSGMDREVAGAAAGSPEASESPEALVERHEEGDRLIDALQLLAAKQRIAVVLRHIVGLSYPEMAEVLACPEGTAKSHVSRGLDQLRVLLSNDLHTHNQEVLP